MARTYVRKTVDEYEIQQYLNKVWECVCTEETWKEAKAQVKTYRVNQPEYLARIVKKRVKKEQV